MPRRNSLHEIQDLADLNRLGEVVLDKRQLQRAAKKRNRRNRHVEKQFIRHALKHAALPGPLSAQTADDDALSLASTEAPQRPTRA